MLTGCCDGWSALGWTVDALAQRLDSPGATVWLDGGPGFARESLSRARVPMREYGRYCAADADGDAAPLYVFDADVVADGAPLRAGWTTPRCFAHDAQVDEGGVVLWSFSAVTGYHP